MGKSGFSITLAFRDRRPGTALRGQSGVSAACSACRPPGSESDLLVAGAFWGDEEPRREDLTRCERLARRVRALTAVVRRGDSTDLAAQGSARCWASGGFPHYPQKPVYARSGRLVAGTAGKLARPSVKRGANRNVQAGAARSGCRCRLTGAHRTCILRRPCVRPLPAGGPYCLYCAPVENLPWR